MTTPTTSRCRAALTMRLMTDTLRDSTLAGIEKVAQKSTLMAIPAIAASYAALTAKGDRAAVEDFVARTAGDREFSIFFKLDQGSTQRLAGIPIESRFYLLGNATIAEGLFKYSPVAGLGAPVRICVSQRDGETTRIDRIAMARAADLRDNEFARWGVR